MAMITWETIKVQYCHHVSNEVSLEVQLVYPGDIMPDQPPRVLAHRCSRGIDCNFIDRPICVWAGTNPTYDPFAR
jgi:hypothetical protein